MTSSSSVRMTRSLTGPVVRRNQRGVAGIALRVNLHAQKAETRADSFANGRGVLADAARKDQCIDPAECSDVGADQFLRLVAEQCQRFGGTRVLGLQRQQFAHIGTGLRNSQQAGFVIRHVVELRCTHVFAAGEEVEQAWIQVAAAVPIGNPEAGVKPMLVSMLLPSRTAAMLAPLPRCARITRPAAAAGSPRRVSSSIR